MNDSNIAPLRGRGKVYAVQEVLRRDDSSGQLVPAYDITPALEYGLLEFLMPGGRMMLSTAPVVASMRTKLKDFCDEDFILPIGDPAAICAASMIAASMNNGRVRVLRWDKFVQRYIPILVDINNGGVHGTAA